MSDLGSKVVVPKERVDVGAGACLKDEAEKERRITGELRFSILDAKTKKVLKQWESKNVILTRAKYQLARLVGAGGADNYVNRMQFGTGSLAETESDVHLQTPITPIKAVAAAYPDALPTSYRVTFSAFLLADEANGFPISEAGLMCVDDTLVARKTFAAQTKTADHIFLYEWCVSF